MVYYTSKTLNEAHKNYTMTEQELLSIVYAFENFRAYLLHSKVIVQTGHAIICYLMEIKEEKPRYIRWVLFLQEFYFKVTNWKGCKNQVADHLPRLESKVLNSRERDIDECFPDKCVMAITNDSMPWYDEFSNYIMCGIFPKIFNPYQMKRFHFLCYEALLG